MRGPIRIALIGDYNPQVSAHVAVPTALTLAGADLVREVEPVWIPTPSIGHCAEQQLSGFDAIWCVPNSPYLSMDGALWAIRFARKSGRPFLGTCGGFQHAVIEYARNVLGLAEADHAESNPDTSLALISRLTCSLTGARGSIRLKPGSRLGSIYGATEIVESYQCNFGLNPRYEPLLDDGRLSVVGRAENSEGRAVELAGHPFFIATLFQPERSAFGGAAHPLICAFVRAAVSWK